MLTPLDPVLYHDWHVVARTDDVQDNQLLSVHLLGEPLLLWRCQGQLLAWQDRCPHRGVPLSGGWVDGNNLIVCPYHGLTFNQAGHCTQIPSAPAVTTFPNRSRVRTYQVQERYGYIWVSLGSPTQAIPHFLEWEESGFIHFHCGPYFINASPLRIIENFTDVAHLPYTHSGLLGSPEFPEISDYALTVSETGITADNICFYQPDPEGTGEAREVSYFYHIHRPLIAYFKKGSEDLQFSIFLAVTPLEELRSIAWLVIARNYAIDISNEALRRFQDHLMSQDIPMVESQRPQRLPLDLQAEFHVPADKLSVAYRKWLKQLGLTFGAC